MKKRFVLLVIGMSIITGCSNTKTEEPVQSEIIEEIPDEVEEIIEEEEEQIIYGTDYESTWGDLIEANGGEVVWETLTPAQQALVHYPQFDSTNVYWTPKGSNYHAVDWCYTLSRANSILNGTVSEALYLGHGPCSKCVGD